MPIAILLRIPFALDEPLCPWYAQLGAFFMWFGCFPFRYLTSMQLQISVTKVDEKVYKCLETLSMVEKYKVVQSFFKVSAVEISKVLREVDDLRTSLEEPVEVPVEAPIEETIEGEQRDKTD